MRTVDQSALDRRAIQLMRALSALIFLVLLILSWQRWQDLIIDYGRELYVPWQIAQGKMLYRDIFHYYGPFAEHLNALLFLVFGAHVQTLIFFDLCLIAYFVWIIDHLVSRMAGPLTAAFAVFSFATLFALPHYTLIGNYNYLTPYSHALTYGLAIGLSAFAILGRILRQPTSSRIFSLGLLMGLAVMTKIEPSFALWGGVVAVVIVRPRGIFRQGRTVSDVLALLAGVALVPMFFLVFFTVRMGWNEAWHGMRLPFVVAFTSGWAGNAFFRQMSGAADVPGSFGRLMAASAVYVLITLATLAASWGVARIRGDLERRRARITFVIIMATAFYLVSGSLNWNNAFLPLTVIALVFSFIAALRSRDQRELLRLGFGIFAALFLGKMLLNAHIYHYGFVLALPAFLVLLMLLTHDLPLALPEDIFDRRTVQVLFASILVITVCVHLAFSLRLYALKTFPVPTKDGPMFTYGQNIGGNGEALEQTLSYLKGSVREGETLVVLPEGVLLNFLLMRSNPTPYFEFAPPMLQMVGENKMLSAFQRTPPDHLVILERDMSEHGARYFGINYAHDFYTWIAANYRVEFRAGAVPSTGRGFGVLALRRISQQSR